MMKDVDEIIEALNKWWESRDSFEREYWARFLEQQGIDLSENGDIETIIGRWLVVRRRKDGGFYERDIERAIQMLDGLISIATHLRRLFRKLQVVMAHERHT